MSVSQSDTKMNNSIDIEPSGSYSRQAITQAYQELLANQASQPDKIFIGGHELKHLDPNFVSLDEDAQEHPRVSRITLSPVLELKLCPSHGQPLRKFGQPLLSEAAVSSPHSQAPYSHHPFIWL
jgi:hypothetical protein